MADKITSDDILEALKNQYREPDWYLGFEVGNDTGYNTKRHADAIAICPYPSRGYEVRGFEIKVSKSDLKRELEICAKADEMAHFCNYWFLVVPKGLTDDMQIPEPWGIIEYNEGKLRQKKKAEHFKKTDITYGFMCAFIRGIKRKESAEQSMTMEEMRKQALKDMQSQLDWRLKDFETLKKTIEEFRKETGVNIYEWGYISKRDIKAVRFALNLLKADENQLWYMRNLCDEVTKMSNWMLETAKKFEEFSKEMCIKDEPTQ